MKNYKLISSKFPMVDFESLKKSDKKTVAIVNKLLSSSKSGKVKLPLSSSVDIDTSKTVSVDVPSLIRTQYAINGLLSVVYTYEEEKDLNGEAFRVYFAIKSPDFKLPKEILTEPKKNEEKRGSSKDAKAKSEEKKKKEQAEEQAKIEEEEKLDKAFDLQTVALLRDLCISYGLNIPKEKQTDFEEKVLKILHRA